MMNDGLGVTNEAPFRSPVPDVYIQREKAMLHIIGRLMKALEALSSDLEGSRRRGDKEMALSIELALMSARTYLSVNGGVKREEYLRP